MSHDRQSYRDQLRSVTPFLLKTSGPANAGAWKKDGEDHINIGRSATTELGYRLDFDHPRAFVHPILGSFKSLQTLGYFLRAKQANDHIRTLARHELRDFVYDHCGGLRGNVPNYRAVMMHSAYLRLKACAGYDVQMVKSTLPFDSYRTLPSGIRERFEISPWLINGYEEIRRALREGREPDFEDLMDKGSTDIYAGVIKMLNPNYDPSAPVEQHRQEPHRENRQEPLRREARDRKPKQEPRQAEEVPAVNGEAPAVVKKSQGQKKREAKARRLAREEAAAAEAVQAAALTLPVSELLDTVVPATLVENKAPGVIQYATQDTSSDQVFARGETNCIVHIDEAAYLTKSISVTADPAPSLAKEADVLEQIIAQGKVIPIGGRVQEATLPPVPSIPTVEEINQRAQDRALSEELVLSTEEVERLAQDKAAESLWAGFGTTSRVPPENVTFAQPEVEKLG